MSRVLAIGAALAALAGCVAPVDYETADVDPREPDGAVPVHDEDADGMPDASDRCPTIASSNADTDGDGVGDECDPQPGAANRIVLLATFAAAEAPWIPDGSGAWQLDDDALVSAGLPAATSARAPNATVGPIAVAATITAAGAAATDADVSLFDAFDDDRGRGDECAVARGAAGPALVNARVVDGARDPSDRRDAPLPSAVLVAGERFTLAAVRGVDRFACAYDAPPARVTLDRPAPAPPSGTVRIGARNAAVRVHSVIAYSLSY